MNHHLVSRELLTWQPQTISSTLSVVRLAGLSCCWEHRLTAHELIL